MLTSHCDVLLYIINTSADGAYMFTCIATTYDNHYVIRNNITDEQRVFTGVDMDSFTIEQWNTLASFECV